MLDLPINIAIISTVFAAIQTYFAVVQTVRLRNVKKTGIHTLGTS